MFKKIFDLDPKKVEEFIKDEVKNYYSDKDYLKNYEIKINWLVTDDEFYVYLEPKLETKNWKKYSFKGKKNISLSDYFNEISKHLHYDFPAIYGEITGETTFVDKVTLDPTDKNEKMYIFIYNKEYTTVVKDKATGEWFIEDWDEDSDKEIRNPVPADLMEEVKKVNI